MSQYMLSDINLDTLTELFNIGIGQAAASLSDMINENVELSVPHVSCKTMKDAETEIDNEDWKQLSAIKQMFEGDFSGNALLIFPEKDSLALVRRLLDSDISIDEISELEEDVLLEVGNIILNACFYSISNILECKIAGEIPTHSRGNCRQLFSSSGIDSDSIILQLSMKFSIPNHDVHGVISFLMSMNALQKLISLLDQYVAKLSV